MRNEIAAASRFLSVGACWGKRLLSAGDRTGGAALIGQLEGLQLLGRQRQAARVVVWAIAGDPVFVVIKQGRCQHLAQPASDASVLVDVSV